MRHLYITALTLALATGCSDEAMKADAGAGDDAAIATDARATQPDAEVHDDATVQDDAANADAEPARDAEPRDAALPDAEPADTGAPDAEPRDAAPRDATPILDASPVDAAELDATPADAGAPDATASSDAASPDAAPADSGATITCDVVVAPPDTNAGQVGANGGSPGPALACPAGTEVVGVAVRMSDGQTSNNGRSAVGLNLACATVAFDSLGAVVVGTESLVEIAGTGQFGWTPATLTPVTRCPAGSIVSGLSASRGTTGNRFLDLTITCTELRTDGTASSGTQVLTVAGSLTEAGTRDTVDCPSGQVVRIMNTRIGAGFDAASLVCAAPACGP